MKKLLSALFFVLFVQLVNAENDNQSRMAVDEYIDWLTSVITLSDQQVAEIRELRRDYVNAVSGIAENNFQLRNEKQIQFWEKRNKQLDRESLITLGIIQITEYELGKVKEMLGFDDAQVADLKEKLNSYNKVLMGAKYIYDTNSQDFKDVEQMVYQRTYDAIEEICSESQKQRCGDMKGAILTKINNYIDGYIHYNTNSTIN
ncbi:hypothetical protein KMW28_28260 [Flammeovirga yaeyamensis]|uniref:Lysozyme inhibitor LprI N-terminal domain-containing protein n=1 Tax=Flammeovirga yaeyamensis TaxID=367791 RepID=A0AAX1NFB6_9BACT|nr:hypothetical protein [Flammeovirga yaeyamensis]MBB3697290.1 uncharacterized protein YfkK (UPF0435 family) [Flammeovirga yaeyamensis]NMF33947.1 hypothetical protein [Flammeovirga yaeyamensis]QWG04793.1 hypothetical protein KMW28_28260 [Flammeovirga yaeyamensis]